MPIPGNYEAPNRLSAKERAFQQLQEWIIDGTLQPEEKLNDGELAQALGVSRTPVREALQLLNTQGFVEMRPGVATQVTAVSKEDIAKILPPLAALQALAAEIVAPRVTEEQLKNLDELNEQFAQAIEKNDYYQALKIDESFHGTIISLADNPYILSTTSMLQAHVRRLFFHKSIILTKDSVKEHSALLEAFQKKDKVSASEIARRNWLRPIEVFYKKIQEK